MIIERTLEIPSDRHIFFEFTAPLEIPAGPARVELRVIPVGAEPAHRDDSATPITDSLSGLLSGLGDVDLDEMRTERLTKHLK